MTMATTPNNRLGPRRRISTRAGARLTLLLALVAASVALTQCQMVGDKLTGVQVGTFKRTNDCFKNCQKRQKDAEKDEKKRHQDAIRACGGNSQCVKDENNRHDAAEDAIEAAYKNCINGCHHQGGGDDD